MTEAYTKTDEIAFIFDTETSGLPLWKSPPSDERQPHVLQIGWLLAQRVGNSAEFNIITEFGSVVQLPDEAKVDPRAEAVHGISKEFAQHGHNPENICEFFLNNLGKADISVAHNLNFDKLLMETLFHRHTPVSLQLKNPFCTMLETVELCQLPGRWGKPKWPKLEELYRFLFNESFSGAHDALADVRATARCYFTITAEDFQNGQR